LVAACFAVRKDELINRLASSLVRKPYYAGDAARAIPSAVLAIIHYRQQKPYVCLIKRSSNLKLHKGEIAFPGGRYSAGDLSLLNTALRETKEEVGILFAPEQIIGSLQPVRTITSNHFIVPFVTVQENLPQYSIATEEVEMILDVPLIETLLTMQQDVEHYHLAKDVYKFTYDEHVIWGATSRILKQLHELLITKK